MDLNDPLQVFMAPFWHLVSAHPEFRFSKPPDPTVREAQSRSVHDFFISYRHQESEAYARGLVAELEALDYKVYYAGAVPELTTLEHEDLRCTLQQALHSSSVLTIIGSENVVGGDWVGWEIETFDAGHWGRQVPIITPEIGTDSWWLQSQRLYHCSAARVHEEDEGAWESQTPSATTIFCLILVREFFRVELDFWQHCASIPPENRPRAYFQTLYEDKVCRTVMQAMLWPHRDYALAQLKKRYLKEARHGRASIWRRIGGSLARMWLAIRHARRLQADKI